MYPFFESIAILNGIILNPEWHQLRINHTFKMHYTKSKPHLLSSVLDNKFNNNECLQKLKFYYNQDCYMINTINYESKICDQFITKEIRNLQYNFKFTDRTILQHFQSYYLNHEVIFTKNHFITDSAIANIVFYTGKHWHTPIHPLLEGTQRNYLLKNKIIQAYPIHLDNLEQYTHFKLINAMNSFESSRIYPISSILIEK